MMVDLLIGIVGTIPFAVLVGSWWYRQPTRTGALVGIAAATVMTIGILGALTATADLSDPSLAMALPVLMAGAVTGVSAKRLGYRDPCHPNGSR